MLRNHEVGTSDMMVQLATWSVQLFALADGRAALACWPASGLALAAAGRQNCQNGGSCKQILLSALLLLLLLLWSFLLHLRLISLD